MKRLAVARFWFQANAFSPLTTGQDAFATHEWSDSRAALVAARDTETELAAVDDFLASHPDWQAEVLRCTAAVPGGPVEEPVFDAILGEIASSLAGRHWDAVYLSLHGAAASTERHSADFDLVRAIRLAIGNTPMAASLSLHANLNPAMAELLDFATSYRTYPYTDRRETAARALHVLAGMTGSGRRLARAVVATGMVIPSLRTVTESGPMHALLQQARELERDGVADVSMLCGFAHADSPNCGAKVLAWADNEARARQAATGLATAWQAARSEFRLALPGPNVALSAAIRAPAGLSVVTDPADSPGYGGLGDSTPLLRALLDLGLGEPSVFSFFANPEVVARAVSAGVGSALDLALGAQRSRDFGAAIPVSAKVLKLTDGKYRNEGPVGTGVAVEFGPTAVLQVGATRVIVTTRCLPAHDPAFYKLHDIDLAATRLLCVKSDTHASAAFGGLVRSVIACEAPGPAAGELRLLPFRNLRPG